MNSRLDGMTVIESRFAVTRTTEEHPRSWRERLFSLPWRPWRTTRVEVRREPAMFRIGNNLFIHPELREELRRGFDQEAAS